MTDTSTLSSSVPTATANARLTELYLAHNAALLRTCRKVHRTREDIYDWATAAEDTIAELWEEILLDIRSGMSDITKSYLTTKAIFLSRRKRRELTKAHVRTESIDAISDQENAEGGTRNALDALMFSLTELGPSEDPRIGMIREAVEQLSPALKHCIQAFYWHGKSTKEIAAKTGKAMGTISWNLAEARRQIMEHVTGQRLKKVA